MVDADVDAVRVCETRAGSFGQAFQTGEFDDIVELFESGAAEEFVTLLKEDGLGTLLSDEPSFVFRRCRRALEALYGDIESATVSEATETEESIHVSVTFHCESGSTQVGLEFNQEGEITEVSFRDSYTPPSYVDTALFDEQSVTIDCGDIELEGVLTMPIEVDNPPIALLILGAGELEKEYTFGPNQFFKDLAWGLATEGIATLRYDKREAVTDISPDERTLETLYFSDGVAALERAAGITGVDSSGVFVVGHSQGGRCAFEIARRHGDVAGVAALDSPLLKPLEPEPDHYHDLLELDGELPPFVHELTDEYAAERRRFFDEDYEPDGEVMEIPAMYLDSTYAYDQFEIATSLSVPLFIYQMELELRAPEEKRSQWKTVVSGEKDTLIQRPELNHNFQRGEQPRSMLEPVLFHQNVDYTVIDDLASWISNVS
jgi:dienelactone hydrolase